MKSSNKPGNNFFVFNKVSIKKEYVFYQGTWRHGYAVRYWKYGPLFNVYKTYTQALNSLSHCVKIRERNYTLAGKRIYSNYEYMP